MLAIATALGADGLYILRRLNTINGELEGTLPSQKNGDQQEASNPELHKRLDAEEGRLALDVAGALTGPTAVLAIRGIADLISYVKEDLTL